MLCYATLPDIVSHTELRSRTPHHKTGARLVAQSNVNRLISQMTASTGIGDNTISVLPRKGKAATISDGRLELMSMVIN